LKNLTHNKLKSKSLTLHNSQRELKETLNSLFKEADEPRKTFGLLRGEERL